MKEIKIGTGKSGIFAICTLLVLSLVIVFLINSGITVWASESETPAFETKVYSQATINEEFDDSSVIVVMDKIVSGINKIHDEYFFGDFEKEYIKDLTMITGDAKSKGIDKASFRQILKIKLPVSSKENVLDVIRQLEKIEGIQCVEPNYIGQAGAIPPSNTNYANQWGIDGINGTLGIQAREAWDITTGSRNVRVGIMDSGIWTHGDLNGNLVAGKDFTGNNTTTDTYGHGTHVAGIVGGIGNTNNGIAGVAWNVSLVPLRIGTGIYWDVANIIAALTYARDTWNTNQRIHIINFSGWKFPYSVAFRDAIQDYPGLFVCIAGNAGININGLTPDYPGSFNCTNQITVGSIDSNGAISSFSNVGSIAVDIFAPGGNILSTYPSTRCSQGSNVCQNDGSTHISSGYHRMNGTSMAAPLVAGVAALLLSHNPNLSTTQLRAAILNNITPVAALSGFCVTGGRLNANATIRSLFNYSYAQFPTGSKSKTYHIAYCLCGDYIEEVHSFNLGICTKCGYDSGNTIWSIIELE